MSEKHNNYITPLCEVIEMEVQGMIAASTDGLTLPGYGAGTVPEP